ncbi:MAG: hypothetical protein JXR96_11125 [Deltaproteobacteria bacterium]|nr:hypothetical protein [Deltaproteobacteria bacterium]
MRETALIVCTTLMIHAAVARASDEVDSEPSYAIGVNALQLTLLGIATEAKGSPMVLLPIGKLMHHYLPMFNVTIGLSL